MGHRAGLGKEHFSVLISFSSNDINWNSSFDQSWKLNSITNLHMGEISQGVQSMEMM